MANNDFHEDQQRKPIFYSCPTPSNPPTPSLTSTPLVLTPELPTPSQPPLFHIREQATIDDDDEYFNSFPAGYKFVPTDDELIVYYLKRKLQNLPLPRNKITEVKLYDHHPQKLAEQYKNRIQQNYWYFFTPRDRKYKNGSRPNRAAGNGFWKATGADREVKHKGHVVGLRKSLVYYVGKLPKGTKTNWLMHEFRMKDPQKPRIGSNDMKLDDWVLCRVEQKNERHVAKKQREDSVDNENQDDVEMNETNNNLMVTPFADHSLLIDQYDPDLLNYPNPFPISSMPTFDFGYNVEDVNNQLESQHFGSYGNHMMPNNPFRPSWTFNATQENLFSSNCNVNDDVLYTGIFDEIDPSGFTSFPGPDLPAFPPSEFGNNQLVQSARIAPVNSENSKVVETPVQPAPVQPVKTKK